MLNDLLLKMLCSARLQGNFNQSVGVDRQFWENVQNPVDIERERSHRQAEAVAATQHMTTNNLCLFQEDTRVSKRENTEFHTTDVTPIPNATVNSGPGTKTFSQELTNYTEEVSSQRIPLMVYISGSNPRSQQARVN